MVFDLSKITTPHGHQEIKEKSRSLFQVEGKTFLVKNKNTIEVRCDNELSKHLQEKYESVMQSRYFGRGGIEIVLTKQLSKQEINDLIRLSYDMTDKS